MKWLIAAAVLVSLTSCNTLIGIGRDVKHGYQWTRGKIQESNSGGYENESYGGPVY